MHGNTVLTGLFLLLSSIALRAGPLQVLISVDGLRPDAITPRGAPAICVLMSSGASARNARTIPSSRTLPAHASMLTGQPMEVHGIDWNSEDESRGFLQVPSALSLATRAGRVGGFFSGKLKMRDLAPPRSASEIWIQPARAAEVMARALRFIREKNPDLVFVHLADCDMAGHGHGWMSPEYLEAVTAVDGQIAALRQELEGSSRKGMYGLLITADHGGSGNDHQSGRIEDKQIPWILWGPGVKRAVTLPDTVSVMDTTPTLLHLAGLPVPEGLAGRIVTEALRAPAGPGKIAAEGRTTDSGRKPPASGLEPGGR